MRKIILDENKIVAGIIKLCLKNTYKLFFCKTLGKTIWTDGLHGRLGAKQR